MCSAQPVFQPVLESMREENADMRARLAHLQQELEHQADQHNAAEDKLRALSASRSAALARFAMSALRGGATGSAPIGDTRSSTAPSSG